MKKPINIFFIIVAISAVVIFVLPKLFGPFQPNIEKVQEGLETARKAVSEAGKQRARVLAKSFYTAALTYRSEYGDIPRDSRALIPLMRFENQYRIFYKKTPEGFEASVESAHSSSIMVVNQFGLIRDLEAHFSDAESSSCDP